MKRIPDEREIAAPSHAAWRSASLVVFVAGFAMRWAGLARFPFEQDELYTVQEAQELFATTLRPGIDARPIYYLLHNFLSPILPAGEFGARIPAFVLGIVGLVVTYRLGKHLAGEAGGFVAISLCAVSPWHLFVSGEARYWSAIYLLAASMILLLLKARESDGWMMHVSAGLCIVLGALTHPTFIFPAVGIAAALLIDPTEHGLRLRWPSRRSLLATWLPAAVLVGGYMLNLKFSGRGSTLSNWSGRGLTASLRLLPAMVQLATPVLVATAAVGLISALGSNKRAKQFALLGFGGLSSGTVLLLAASMRTDVYADYGVAMLPLGIAAVTCALLFPGMSRVGPLAIALVVVLVTATLPETISQLSDGMRYDYRPALSRIATAPPAPSLVWPMTIQRYYAPNIEAVEFARRVPQLDSLAATSARFWVVASENRLGLVSAPDRGVQEWLDQNCDTDMRTTGRRLDYRTYSVVLYACEGASVERVAP